jgi:hypothetical protein
MSITEDYIDTNTTLQIVINSMIHHWTFGLHMLLLKPVIVADDVENHASDQI